jgi:hypothetical protein
METANTIKLSKTTLAILKNFASLNSNILVTPGNVIKTITPSMTGMAEATVEETFEQEFGIWDLNKFLGVITLFQNPEFEFEKKFVKIHGGNDTVVNYFYSEPRLLTVPTKNVNMPEANVEAYMSQEMFSELTRASSILQLPNLTFKNKGNDIVAVVCDKNDPTSNSCEIKLEGSANDCEFNFNFKIENIRLLAGNYKISFAKNIVGQFENENIPLKYWFAMDPSSTYNG